MLLDSGAPTATCDADQCGCDSTLLVSVVAGSPREREYASYISHFPGIEKVISRE